jgi:hypothetical protein
MYKWNVTSTFKGETTIEEVLGSKLHEYKGITFFAHKRLSNDGYTCTSSICGLNFGTLGNTIAEAIKLTKQAIDKYGEEKVKQLICNAVKTLESKSIILDNFSPVPAEEIYMQHYKTGNVIKGYEQKKGYKVIPKEEYDRIHNITDIYFRHKTDGIVDFIPKERLLNNPELISRINLEEWETIDKKTYIKGMVNQCKARLLKCLDDKNYSTLLHIVTNNSNKYSIKAMEQIMDKSLPSQAGEREKIITEWLGQSYMQWKIQREVEVEIEQQQKEYEAEVKIQKAIKEAKNIFMAGQKINPEQFILLCKSYGIKLPLKTHGWINKHVGTISTNNYSSTKGKTSSVIWQYIKELQEKLAS